MVYKLYILTIGGLYDTYHLLREPKTTIDLGEVFSGDGPDDGFLIIDQPTEFPPRFPGEKTTVPNVMVNITIFGSISFVL